MRKDRTKLQINRQLRRRPLLDQIRPHGLVDAMPIFQLNIFWQQFQSDLSRRNTSIFRRIILAIYMNEYAFCWKQDSVLSQLVG
jgi:hypothetical protein